MANFNGEREIAKLDKMISCLDGSFELLQKIESEVRRKEK